MDRDGQGMEEQTGGNGHGRAASAAAPLERPWPGDLVRLRARAPDAIISHGDTALVMGDDGAVERSGNGHGLFVHETRLLCLHRFRIGRQRPFPVTLSAIRQDHWLGYYLAPLPGVPLPEDENPAQALTRESLELQVTRTVGDGMHEDLRLTNLSGKRVRCTLVLEADGDFLGPDEVHDPAARRGRISRRRERVDDGFAYVWDHRARHRAPHDGRIHAIHRRLLLRVRTTTPVSIAGGRFRFPITLAPGERWDACLEWSAEIDGHALAPPPCGCDPDADGERARREPGFLRHATSFHSPESGSATPWLLPALERARRDLHALRLHRLDEGDERAWTVAAGIPAYMGLFGRDVLTTGTQAVMLGPEMLGGALREMAACQGRRRDDWRDEQPGRMLHEVRVDPAATLHVRPTGRYYGALTSAGLFALAVSELWRWTGDRERVGAFLDPALRGLHWLNRDARQVQGVFHAVRTRSPQGLDNQTWKDSSESVVDADGNVVDQPVATCEEQGIAYLAQRRLAQVLRAVGRADDARSLEAIADALKARFNDAYWLQDQGFLAMALDPRGRPVASLGSNALRCLASGIVDASLAPVMCRRAFEPDLFSGWGMRTLASSHPAYHPYGYHRGAVWPVEHGPFALGLRRYGLREDMLAICRAQFDLVRLFEGYRLPECVAGHPRDELHPFPALYPAANSPQAWSAATPLALLQAMLGLEPQASAGRLWVDPWLPDWLPEIHVRDLRVGHARVDLRFWRDGEGGSRFQVLDCRGALQVDRRDIDWAFDADER